MRIPSSGCWLVLFLRGADGVGYSCTSLGEHVIGNECGLGSYKILKVLLDGYIISNLTSSPMNNEIESVATHHFRVIAHEITTIKQYKIVNFITRINPYHHNKLLLDVRRTEKFLNLDFMKRKNFGILK